MANVTITITASGRFRIFQARVEGIFPVGSAYMTDWITPDPETRNPPLTDLTVLKSQRRFTRRDTGAIPPSATDGVQTLFQDGTNLPDELDYSTSMFAQMDRHIVLAVDPPYTDLQEYQVALFTFDSSTFRVGGWQPDTSGHGYPSYTQYGGYEIEGTDVAVWYYNTNFSAFSSIERTSYTPNVLRGEADNPNSPVTSRSVTGRIKALNVVSETDPPRPIWQMRLANAGDVATDTEGRKVPAPSTLIPNSNGVFVGNVDENTADFENTAVLTDANAIAPGVWGVISGLDPDWALSDPYTLTPNRSIGVFSPWQVDLSCQVSNSLGSSALSYTYQPPRYRLLYYAQGYQSYPGGVVTDEGSVSEPTVPSGEWHTCDNHEPPPDGKPWGDWGVEAGWAHVSWMRLKDKPGSGRTGRLKVCIADAPSGGGGGGSKSVDGTGGTPELEPYDPPDDPTPVSGVAAISYNMPGWVPQKPREIRELQTRGSIIALQECQHFQDELAAWPPDWHWHQPRIGGFTTTTPIGVDLDVWTVLDSGAYKLSDWTWVQPEATGTTRKAPRWIVWLEVAPRAGGEHLIVGSTHFTPSKHLGGAARELWTLQRDRTVLWLQGQTLRTILLGDFNGQPHETIAGPLRAAAGYQTAVTHKGRRIDIAWHRGGLTPTGSRALSGFASDHKPLRATYTF